MNTEIRVRETMNKDVITIDPASPVSEAAKLMSKYRIGSVVVVQGEKPVGIITERDIAYSIAATDLKPSQVKVEDIMSSEIKSIGSNKILTEASKLMGKHNIRRLPVIEEGRLVGIISNKDILAVAPSQIEVLRELVSMKEEPENVPREVPERGTCEVCGDYGVVLRNVNEQYVCEHCEEDLEVEE